MADSKVANDSLIPPRDLKLSLEEDFDVAMDKIKEWVREQGIAVDDRDIQAKADELHEKWREAKNSGMQYITFKRDGGTETSNS